MSKLTDSSGEPIKKIIPPIKGVEPIGNQILVELLTPQELMNTPLHLGNAPAKTINGAPQAYVMKIGPMVAKEWGLNEGLRVVLSGNFTPLPEAASKNDRPLAMVEPHTIKAILVE